MRKILFGLALALVSQSALARNYGMAGCGLGAQVMGKDGSQVLAATTNATGMNGFAISSGTSECIPPGKMAAVRAQEQFFASNLKVLSKEMAQGEGEYVKALAQTMGCKPEVHGDFAKEMQKSYQTIFNAPTSSDMLDKVRSTVKSSSFNNSCDTVI